MELNEASPKFKEAFKKVEWVILDEIHDICDSKRGAFLSLTLERLRHHCDTDFVRIGVVENCGVGGDPESALYGFFYALYGDVVRAGLVYGFIVHFPGAVEVYAQRQIFARLV